MTIRTPRPQYNPVEVVFEDGKLVITTEAQDVLEYPLSDFPWLEQATDEQREDFDVYTEIIHWNSLESGLDLEYLIHWHNATQKQRGFRATDLEWDAIKSAAKAVNKSINDYLLDAAAAEHATRSAFFPRNPKKQGGQRGRANGRWSGG